MTKVKKECDYCHLKYYSIHPYKIWGLCYNCYVKAKKHTSIPGAHLVGDAQEKVRGVVVHFDKETGNIKGCRVSLPRCYAGKKVKVIVVEEEKEVENKAEEENNDLIKEDDTDGEI